MRRSPSAILASAATTQLGLLLTWAATAQTSVPLARWLLGLMAAVALVAATRMDTEHGVTARAVAAAIGLLALTGVALASTVGLPGATPRPLDVPAVVLAVAAVAVVGLAVTPTGPSVVARDPYAS